MRLPRLTSRLPVLFLTAAGLAAFPAFLTSCATAHKKTKAERKAEHQAQVEQADFNDLQKTYAAGSLDLALQKANAFERKHSKGEMLPEAYNVHGLIYLVTKRPLQAIPYFKRSVQASGNPAFRQYVLFNLGAAQFEANQLDEVQQTLSEVSPDALDAETRVKFHALRSRLYAKRGMHAEAARELVAAKGMTQDTIGKAPLLAQLEQSLQQLTDTSVLESIYKDGEDSPLADAVLFRLGSQEVIQGKTGSGEKHLRDLISRFPGSPHLAEANDLVRSVQQRKVVDNMAVGVLLPMKGKFARFGQRSLQAIELAFRVFNLDEPNSQVSLVVEDSGEEPEQAVHALDTLFFKHHVIAVVGPLLSKGVDQVTQRAQELGLPLISLAQQPGINGDWVFQSGLTPAMQAAEVARYAVDDLGLERFAIIYPRDKFGEQYSESFWDAVDRLGGKVVGVESYNPGETDFRMVIDKLSGLYYTEARSRELEALAKQREELNIRKRTRKTEQYYNLKPIVDYQAVFIPDEPKVVGQILPTFAYRDVYNVRFLGVSTWHSPELLQRASSYAEGSVFVDGYFAESANPVVRRFVERYRLTFGQDPGAMEAMAYDAASLLDQALGGGAASSREEVRDRLHGVADYHGVSGKISYQDGQFRRSLTFLTVNKGQIKEIGQ